MFYWIKKRRSRPNHHNRVCGDERKTEDKTDNKPLVISHSECIANIFIDKMSTFCCPQFKFHLLHLSPDDGNSLISNILDLEKDFAAIPMKSQKFILLL